MADGERKPIGGEIPPVLSDLHNVHAIYGYAVESSNRDYFPKNSRPGSDMRILNSIFQAAGDARASCIGFCHCHVDVNDILEDKDGPYFIILAISHPREDREPEVENLHPATGNVRVWIESLGLEGSPRWT
ncbi:uncharacterized protein BXZ73DRAFT_80147 [Epithele typhae]|uniref:uncharacterized protein n=1 Tax=Epithele typhae TaxID=378194 RepID=UPI002007A654|nr:uncharacterized protein BXZ73DRAFT_80147 [Epithele typhae]KAH9920193.1 hypothetical protein BXZ73DRAFT_80147 [Epithele typhae]